MEEGREKNKTKTYGFGDGDLYLCAMYFHLQISPCATILPHIPPHPSRYITYHDHGTWPAF